MDLSFLMEAKTWIGFVTLLVLEIVLGIDNLVFVAILANKAHPKHRDTARITGLSLAIVIRVVMLGFMSYILTLTAPKSWLWDHSIKDLIMLLGGLFLIFKATTELHERLEGSVTYTMDNADEQKHAHIWTIVMQIVVLDAIFSLDSVITAVHIVDHVIIAMVAVVVAMMMMIWASKPLTTFVDRHPTVVILCLGFLLMIGFSLIAEGFKFEIPKGYLYAAIGFSILIEIFNQVALKNTRRNEFTDRTWRKRTADSVLGMMGIREQIIAKASEHGEVIDDTSVYEENEKRMIRSVLTLGERAIPAIMTPRMEIERLDISQPKKAQIEHIMNTPFSRLVVVGKAGIEEPLGYVAKKDLLTHMLQDNKLDLDIDKSLKQPLFIPETTNVLKALEEFRSSSADLALVVDEFGTIMGLLTMKDMLETIAGEFPEEYERSEGPSLKVNEDGSINAEGSVEWDEVAQELGLPMIGENSDFHTVGGFIMEMMEIIPKEGDSFRHKGHEFTVEKMEGQRISDVRIRKLTDEEMEEEEEKSSGA